MITIVSNLYFFICLTATISIFLLIINWCCEYVHPFVFEYIHKSITEYGGRPCYDDVIFLDVIRIDVSELLYKLIEFYMAFKFYFFVRDIEEYTRELAFVCNSNRFKLLRYLTPFKDYLKILDPNQDITKNNLKDSKR